MATYNQTAGWSTNSFWIDGTTSGRNILFAAGDNISAPPLMGRINGDFSTPTSTQTVIVNLANPTTEELFVEKVIFNIDTASSSSCCLSCGIATASASSASNIADQTIGCSTAGLIMCNSSATLPVSWLSTGYFTVFALSSSGTPAALVGDVSVFYCAVPNT